MMKHLSALIVLSLGILSFILLTSELKSSSASPGGKTGSPLDGVTCTQCHGGTATMQAGWISSNIPASGYVPGQTYTITATATHTGASLFGFELTAESPGTGKVGGLIATNTAENQLLGNGNAITHKAAGTAPTGNSRSWSFDWNAPAAGTGDVTFYAAFNAANGNGTTSGDVIYTSTLGVQESMGTGLDMFKPLGRQIYPNPATEVLHLEGFPANTFVRLYSQDGRMVRESALQKGNASISINALKPGIYFLQEVGNQDKLQKIIVQ
jgi:hypothetical protein